MTSFLNSVSNTILSLQLYYSQLSVVFQTSKALFPPECRYQLHIDELGQLTQKILNSDVSPMSFVSWGRTWGDNDCMLLTSCSSGFLSP